VCAGNRLVIRAHTRTRPTRIRAHAHARVTTHFTRVRRFPPPWPVRNAFHRCSTHLLLPTYYRPLQYDCRLSCISPPTSFPYAQATTIGGVNRIRTATATSSFCLFAPDRTDFLDTNTDNYSLVTVITSLP